MTHERMTSDIIFVLTFDVMELVTLVGGFDGFGGSVLGERFFLPPES